MEGHMVIQELYNQTEHAIKYAENNLGLGMVEKAHMKTESHKTSKYF